MFRLSWATVFLVTFCQVCLANAEDPTREEAFTKLTGLGAYIRAWREDTGALVEVFLDDEWKGRDDDLALLRFVGDIRGLHIARARMIGDKGIANLTRLENVEELRVSVTAVSDDGLRQFAQCSRVEMLCLSESGFTDAGFKHFSNCSRLKVLISEDNPGITGTGLASLRSSKSLQKLYLLQTSFNDAGAASLVVFPELSYLDLTETRVTDKALASIGQLKKLETLSLRNTYVSDKGLHYLAELPELRFLNLGKTFVTDGGLKHLAGLPRLQEIILDQTKVTAASAKRAFPKCKVILEHKPLVIDLNANPD